MQTSLFRSKMSQNCGSLYGRLFAFLIAFSVISDIRTHSLAAVTAPNRNHWFEDPLSRYEFRPVRPPEGKEVKLEVLDEQEVRHHSSSYEDEHDDEENALPVIKPLPKYEWIDTARKRHPGSVRMLN